MDGEDRRLETLMLLALKGREPTIKQMESLASKRAAPKSFLLWQWRELLQEERLSTETEINPSRTRVLLCNSQERELAVNGDKMVYVKGLCLSYILSNLIHKVRRKATTTTASTSIGCQRSGEEHRDWISHRYCIIRCNNTSKPELVVVASLMAQLIVD